MSDYYLRQLAKSVEMQNLFIASKEINGIKLFENKKDLSKLQGIFLSYLYFYCSLNNDIATDRVNKKVLENEIYCDAYAYYRNNVKEKIDNTESNKQRTFQGVFSKDNTIKFPSKDK